MGVAARRSALDATAACPLREVDDPPGSWERETGAVRGVCPEATKDVGRVRLRVVLVVGLEHLHEPLKHRFPSLARSRVVLHLPTTYYATFIPRKKLRRFAHAQTRARDDPT